MRAFHFLPACWALDDIAKQQMKVSEIDQTNDPFELWCVSQPNRSLRDALRDYKRTMSERFGLICFSEDWENPLLWSHYADKHRGICLGFEGRDSILKKVRYAKRRLPLKLPLTNETADRLLWTKYWDWKYEREWRIWLKLDERDGDSYFYKFESQPDLLRLREVIVGPLCETTEEQVRTALDGRYDGVKIMKARLAFRTFRVVVNRNVFKR
jgi:hypothetical protein